ncbi:tRNA (N6-threonylcarbamoyladenosine(37)-N6)-methyltransferase TrmO [Bacteroidota bacterium]
MDDIKFKPIGIIHSVFKNVSNMPIQPKGAKGIKGTIEIKPEYVAGLKDLSGFSHIILLYHLHLTKGYSLEVVPFMDNHLRGVFSTRAPKRPNPIGLSVVKLIKIENNILYIENVDIVDNTPLIDIKPYIPAFDEQEVFRIGWLAETENKVKNKRSDNRFK